MIHNNNKNENNYNKINVIIRVNLKIIKKKFLSSFIENLEKYLLKFY